MALKWSGIRDSVKRRLSSIKEWINSRRVGIKDWSDIFKNIIEPVAIVAAGMWAVYTFGVKEKPGLEHRAKLESELNWNQASSAGACEAEFKVKFENIGTTSFYISKIRLQAWELPAIMLDDKNSIKYLDVNELQAGGTRIFEKIYTKPRIQSITQQDNSWTPFLGHYSPGNTWNHSFQFIVKRVSNRWVLFKVELFEEGSEDTPKDAAYEWELVCGGEAQEKPSDNPQSPK